MNNLLENVGFCIVSPQKNRSDRWPIKRHWAECGRQYVDDLVSRFAAANGSDTPPSLAEEIEIMKLDLINAVSNGIVISEIPGPSFALMERLQCSCFEILMQESGELELIQMPGLQWHEADAAIDKREKEDGGRFNSFAVDRSGPYAHVHVDPNNPDFSKLPHEMRHLEAQFRDQMRAGNTDPSGCNSRMSSNGWFFSESSRAL